MSHRQLDEIDYEILRHLQENGRITNQNLAKLVGLSPTPCQERVKKLEREGVIAGYKAIISAATVGLPMMLMVSVILDRTTGDVYQKARDAFAAIPEILEAYMVTGEVDYLLKMRVRSIDHFRELLETAIVPLPFIKITHSLVVMEETKSGATLPLTPAAS
jgi:Lrp/AsnC family leucine-responsive transcriptional regulator